MPRQNRWLALFVVTRLIATVAGVTLLLAHQVATNSALLAVVAAAYGGGTILAAMRFQTLQWKPTAWTADAVMVLTLILTTGTYRSPFYILALTALILPATGLSLRRAFGFGAAFTAAYAAIGVSSGIDWTALEQTYKLESFTTHLLVPLIIVISLAYAAEVLRSLQDERARSERLAVEAERRRIAWELHDSAKQRVHAAHLMLSQHRRREGNGNDPMLEQALAELSAAGTDIETSLTELRTPLEGQGILEGVRKRASELERLSGVEIDVSGDVPELPTTTAAHAFRVIGEAMTNAVRHAAATRIWVRLSGHERRFSAEVADNGRGIPDDLRPGSNGVRSMRRRAGMLGGRLEIVTGDAPPEGRNGASKVSNGTGADGGGRGTTVRLEVPLDGRAVQSERPREDPPVTTQASEPGP